MQQPAARRNDTVTGVDNHIVMVPNPGGETPTPLPHPFSGRLTSNLCSSVLVNGEPAAVVGSVADHDPPGHVPTPPGTRFVTPPPNRGQVQTGSTSVYFETRAAARQGDPVVTCNDPPPLPPSRITSGSFNVQIG